MPVLIDALAEIAARKPGLRFQHWGDADLGGLRIWWFLRTRVGRALTLFRTHAEWLEEAVRSGGGVPLDEGERTGLTRLRRQLAAADQASAPDISDGLRLIDALLRLGAKVEQERW